LSPPRLAELVDQDPEALARVRLDEPALVELTELLVHFGDLVCEDLEQRFDDAPRLELVEPRALREADFDQGPSAACRGAVALRELAQG
jgi:hypothetical protein